MKYIKNIQIDSTLQILGVGIAIISIFIYFCTHYLYINFEIPDVINLSRDLKQNSFADLMELKHNKLIYILYYIPYQFNPFFGPSIMNISLVFFLCFYKINIGLHRIVFPVLVFFPFFIYSSLFPSKDFIALYLMVFFYYSLIKREYVTYILLIFIMFFVRDIFSVLMIIIVLYHIGFMSRWKSIAINNPKTYLLVILGLCMLASELIHTILLNFDILPRMLRFYELDSFRGGWIGYLYRVAGNIFNLSTRVPFYDGMKFNVIHFLYFLSGVSFLSLLIHTKIHGTRENKLLLYTLILILSISPYVQPRYLISFVGIFYMHSNQVIRYFLPSLIFSLIVSILYFLFGVYPDVQF